MENNPTVSIIVPIANERELIADALKHFLSLGADELIVVDGGSTDGTHQQMEDKFPGIPFFQTAYPNRAMQMNLGAFESTGDVLLFLHVDMRLPQVAVVCIREKIRDGFVAGGFTKRYVPSNCWLRTYAACLNTIYLRWMHCLVGTNAMFVKKSVFDVLHGFAETAFLEDVSFSDCVKKLGRLAIIRGPVSVSSRRYLQNGIAKQIIRNGRILLGYKVFREDPEDLGMIYNMGCWFL